VFESAEQVIRGRRPTGEALEALDRDVDRILEKRRWILDRQAIQ
jgi:multiple sugar transport system substrate-binding protein